MLVRVPVPVSHGIIPTYSRAKRHGCPHSAHAHTAYGSPMVPAIDPAYGGRQGGNTLGKRRENSGHHGDVPPGTTLSTAPASSSQPLPATRSLHWERNLPLSAPLEAGGGGVVVGVEICDLEQIPDFIRLKLLKFVIHEAYVEPSQPWECTIPLLKNQATRSSNFVSCCTSFSWYFRAKIKKTS